MFICRKCGKCCELMKYLQQSLPEEFADFRELAKELDSGDGICRYLDREARLCRIYESRPLLCNNALFFEQRLKDLMTREEFDKILNFSCKTIRSDEILQ